MGRIGSDEVAEVVISFCISVFTELNRAFDYGHIIFVDHGTAVCHLCDDTSLSKVNLFGGIYRHVGDGFDKLQVVAVQRSTFIIT